MKNWQTGKFFYAFTDFFPYIGFRRLLSGKDVREVTVPASFLR